MTQHCTFVDPSSLSLPSSSLKRPASPSTSSDHSSPCPADDPPRKRPRSSITPEERKEARAHRNRIAAQNSRDRRKAQFTYLERRVAELEEENRRLRAGIHVSPSPSISAVSEPDVAAIEREQEQLRKREEDQRERENQELRERIRTLEKGYEAVVRALAAQGNPTVTSTVPVPDATPVVLPTPQSSSQSASNSESSDAAALSSLDPASSLTISLPLSPTSSNSTLVDSPLLFASGDSFEVPHSPLSPNEASPALPSDTGGEHRRLFGSVPAAGGRCPSGSETSEHTKVLASDATEPEDEAASDAAITRLFAEILASPPLGSSTLPGSCSSSEDAFSEEVLKTNTPGLDLDIGMSGISTGDWTEQVRAEMEMEKLLEMLPKAQDVAIDADMDLSSALTWDGVSVF